MTQLPTPTPSDGGEPEFREIPSPGRVAARPGWVLDGRATFPTARTPSRRAACAALLLGALLLPRAEGAGWKLKEDCRLLPNPANDGDSFHARSGKTSYIFRLYFVDAPETDRLVPERVAEQAAYWGIAEEDVLRAGREAAKFTQDFLKDGFEARTRFANAMGRSDKERIYAWITARDTTLAEALVRAGLARVYGVRDAPDDGPGEDVYSMRLRKLEREARDERRGAWAFAAPKAGRHEALNPAPDIPEQTVLVQRHTQILAPDGGHLLGILTPGSTVTVLRAESASMVRVRLPTSGGKEPREGVCRREDLGL
jgi:endonuclease YncB( thermonuclease family)